MAEPAGWRGGPAAAPGTGVPGWRGAAMRAVGQRRPADLYLGGLAGIVVGVIVIALTGPSTISCGGGACTGVDIVRVCAIVAIVAGACSFVAGFVASALRRGPPGTT